MPTPFVKTPRYPTYTDGTGPRAQTFYGVDSLIPLGPSYIRDEKGELVVDRQSIMCVRVPKGVVMYPMSYLENAIRRENEGLSRYPLLERSG